MLTPDYSTRFKKDLKLAEKRGYAMQNIAKVMNDLVNEIPLEPKHKEHALIGNYKGYTECHIDPDWWLLIYKINKQDTA